jgi:hypothetical protein
MIFDVMYLHGMKVGKLLDDLAQMTYSWWALSPFFLNKLCHFGDNQHFVQLLHLWKPWASSTSMQK